jgi:hypothetical protein
MNAAKTKYMFMTRHQNAGQNHDIKRANRSFVNMAEFRHLGTTGTNQLFIHEEIKSRLNSRNACYHLVQNIIFSDLYLNIYKLKYVKL